MISLEHLDAEHLDPFCQALINVLSTGIAETTYAQIMDGQPIMETYVVPQFFTQEGMPVLSHKTICPGSLEKTRAFRSSLDVRSFKFEAKVSASS